MAQIDIKTIEKLQKERNTVHEKVYATYSTFDSYGEHYVQIDTYDVAIENSREKQVSQFSWIKKWLPFWLICLKESLISDMVEVVAAMVSLKEIKIIDALKDSL